MEPRPFRKRTGRNPSKFCEVMNSILFLSADREDEKTRAHASQALWYSS